MWRKISFVLGLLLLAGGLSLPAFAKSTDPLVGTWYSRELESNSFYFVDNPIGGVYPVGFFDDHTASPEVCPGSGPFLWAGLGAKTGEHELTIFFGPWWCPGIAGHETSGPSENGGPFEVTLTYNPDSDTINEPFSVCDGTRQPHIHSVEKAIHELNKGKFPPTGVDVGCDF